MLADHRDGLSSSSFLAWSTIAQSVCQQAFSLLTIGFQRPPGFESCILQRKTTCLLSIRKSLTCARASKLTTTNMYVCMYVRTYIIYIYMNSVVSKCTALGKIIGFLHILNPLIIGINVVIRKSLACARASKLTTTNMYITRARCECQMAVGSGGLNACWS